MTNGETKMHDDVKPFLLTETRGAAIPGPAYPTIVTRAGADVGKVAQILQEAGYDYIGSLGGWFCNAVTHDKNVYINILITSCGYCIFIQGNTQATNQDCINIGTKLRTLLA